MIKICRTIDSLNRTCFLVPNVVFYFKTNIRLAEILNQFSKRVFWYNFCGLCSSVLVYFADVNNEWEIFNTLQIHSVTHVNHDLLWKQLDAILALMKPIMINFQKIKRKFLNIQI